MAEKANQYSCLSTHLQNLNNQKLVRLTLDYRYNERKPKLIGDAMKIRLETLTQGDFENLYAFEVKNRAYFEKQSQVEG